jgi:hypothetical protein
LGGHSYVFYCGKDQSAETPIVKSFLDSLALLSAASRLAKLAGTKVFHDRFFCLQTRQIGAIFRFLIAEPERFTSSLNRC